MLDQTAGVLAERARMLARPLAARADAAGDAKSLLFSVGAGRFAVPLAQAVMVRTITDPESVTDGPPWLLGLVSIAGRTMPVIGIRSYLAEDGHTSPEGGTGRQLVIVIEADGLEAALVADRLDGIEDLPVEAMDLLPPGTSAHLTAVSSGLWGNRVALDPQRLVHELRAAFEATVTASPSRPSRSAAVGAGNLHDGI